MSCFGGVATTATYSSPGMRGCGRRPWRWWRAKCASIAASVGSRIRRSIRGLDGRRRRRRTTASSVPRGWCHHRSFAPVYVDELYNYHQPAKALNLSAVVREEPTPSTSGSKLVAAAGATRASGKATARVGAATTTSSIGARVQWWWQAADTCGCCCRCRCDEELADEEPGERWRCAWGGDRDGGGGPEGGALHQEVQGGHEAAEPEVGRGVPGHAGKRPMIVGHRSWLIKQ